MHALFPDGNRRSPTRAERGIGYDEDSHTNGNMGGSRPAPSGTVGGSLKYSVA